LNNRPPLAKDRKEVMKIIISKKMPLVSYGKFIGILSRKATTVNSIAGIKDINTQNLHRVK
jgi:hypothetical protein